MCEHWNCAIASGARGAQFPACFGPFFLLLVRLGLGMGRWQLILPRQSGHMRRLGLRPTAHRAGVSSGLFPLKAPRL